MSLQRNVHCLSLVKCFNCRMDLHCWLTQKLIIFQYFQTKNRKKLPMSSKSNLFVEAQNWWHNWAWFLGCKNYSYMMTQLFIHVCTFSWLSGLYSALKMLLSLMIRPLFSQGFIFSKLIWEMFEIKLKVSYFLKAMIPCLI